MKKVVNRKMSGHSQSAFNCYAPFLQILFNHQQHDVLCAQFFAAFEQLPKLSQDILRLKYERGHKFTEISIGLNCTASSVNYWFNFGKNNLRRKLNPQYYHKKAGVTTLQWVREQ